MHLRRVATHLKFQWAQDDTVLYPHGHIYIGVETCSCWVCWVMYPVGHYQCEVNDLMWVGHDAICIQFIIDVRPTNISHQATWRSMESKNNFFTKQSILYTYEGPSFSKLTIFAQLSDHIPRRVVVINVWIISSNQPRVQWRIEDVCVLHLTAMGPGQLFR